jgi:hypothetical protein
VTAPSGISHASALPSLFGDSQATGSSDPARSFEAELLAIPPYDLPCNPLLTVDSSTFAPHAVPSQVAGVAPATTAATESSPASPSGMGGILPASVLGPAAEIDPASGPQALPASALASAVPETGPAAGGVGQAGTLCPAPRDAVDPLAGGESCQAPGVRAVAESPTGQGSPEAATQEEASPAIALPDEIETNVSQPRAGEAAVRIAELAMRAAVLPERMDAPTAAAGVVQADAPRAVPGEVAAQAVQGESPGRPLHTDVGAAAQTPLGTQAAGAEPVPDGATGDARRPAAPGVPPEPIPPAARALPGPAAGDGPLPATEASVAEDSQPGASPARERTPVAAAGQGPSGVRGNPVEGIVPPAEPRDGEGTKAAAASRRGEAANGAGLNKSGRDFLATVAEERQPWARELGDAAGEAGEAPVLRASRVAAREAVAASPDPTALWTSQSPSVPGTGAGPAKADRGAAGTPVVEFSLSEAGESLPGLLVERARLARREGEQELRVRVRPPDLGEIRVTFESSQGVLRGTIAVEREEVRAWVAAQAPAWREEMANAGLKVGQLDVALLASGSGGSQAQASGQGAARAWAEPSPSASASGPALAGAVAPGPDEPALGTNRARASGRIDYWA